MDKDEKTLYDEDQDDVQEEFVDPQDSEDVTSGVEAEEQDTDEDLSTEAEEEVANPQTPEENHKFAAYRKQKDAEVAMLKRQIEERPDSTRLINALSQFGYEGSPEEIADMLEANRTGTTPEEVRAERENQEALINEMVQNHPAMIQAQTLLQQQSVMQQKIAADKELAEIRKINPEIKGIQDLIDMNDEVFDALVSSGKMSLSKAYATVHKTPQKKEKMDTKEHLQTVGGGEGGSGLQVEIPRGEYDWYKDQFPNDTPKQLKARYNRILERQKGE